MTYLYKSRQVLEINDPKKLQNLLNEARSELKKLSLGYGRMRMSPLAGKAKASNKKAIRNMRRHIARILTRINQLKQKENRN